MLPLAHRIRHRWRGWRGTPIEGVSIVVTNGAGEVLLLRHSYGPKVWALPGGGFKPGEDPAEAARREVREELGIDLARLDSLGTLEEELSGAPHTAHLFTATARGEPVPDRREVIAARFYPADALPGNVGSAARRRLAAWQDRKA